MAKAPLDPVRVSRAVRSGSLFPDERRRAVDGSLMHKMIDDSSRMQIVILEDDDRRRIAMCDRLSDRFPQFEITVSDSAAECIRAIEANAGRILLASLDHDLVLLPSAGGKFVDPGTGRDVVEFLCERPPTFPVIVHTTNSIAGDGMEFRLVECGWPVERVRPYDDLAWIDEVWFGAARRLLVVAAVYSADSTPNS